MRASRCETPEDYLALAESDAEEYKKLVSALTVNVTRFFRNSETFQSIERLVIPEIIQNREERGENKISVLSVGCSTGEEPYSIAILFLEYLEKVKKQFDFRVIGTDIDKKVLVRATRGIYPEDRVSGVPEELLEKYFVKISRGYRVSQELRRTTLFIKKDVQAYRILRRFDLILARNIMIYFSREYQEVLIGRFYKQLVPGGFLTLGRTESPAGDVRKHFTAVSITDRIYKKL
jgi:chemotaxis protein methyltransferase CheR